jgi:predicted ATPase
LTFSDEKLVKIRQWLSAPDPSVNFEKALKIRQSNTGLWFLESDVYKNWKADASLVWIHGIPGCGKTILSSTVLEDIRQQTRDDPGKALAYFYFDFNDRQKQSSDMLVRSLVAQLTKQCIEVPKSLDKLFLTHDNGYQQPSQTPLLEILHDFIKGFPHVYLIIDALDECEEREELMNIIATVAAWKVQGLHVLLTSRREGNIKLTLENLIDEQNIVCVQADVVDRDIKLYVREQLANNISFRKWRTDDAVRQHIENCLGERARGM